MGIQESGQQVRKSRKIPPHETSQGEQHVIIVTRRAWIGSKLNPNGNIVLQNGFDAASLQTYLKESLNASSGSNLNLIPEPSTTLLRCPGLAALAGGIATSTQVETKTGPSKHLSVSGS